MVVSGAVRVTWGTYGNACGTLASVVFKKLWMNSTRGHLAMSGGIPGCYNWHPVGRDWGAAEHPTMHRAVPTAKSDPAQNVECQV